MSGLLHLPLFSYVLPSPFAMIFKVCGMRDAHNIRAIEQLQPDAMGFIFHLASPRFVDTPPSYLPAAPIRRVGVFVNPTMDEMAQRVAQFDLHSIQLHGDESPEFCRQAKAAFPQLQLIKAFSVATPDDLRPTADYLHVDLYIFDTKGHVRGGSGQQFDWNILHHYAGRKPFLLSGGITPDDGQRARAFTHPRCIGFDLNSRFEIAPALKSPQLLQQFFNAFRS